MIKASQLNTIAERAANNYDNQKIFIECYNKMTILYKNILSEFNAGSLSSSENIKELDDSLNKMIEEYKEILSLPNLFTYEGEGFEIFLTMFEMLQDEKASKAVKEYFESNMKNSKNFMTFYNKIKVGGNTTKSREVSVGPDIRATIGGRQGTTDIMAMDVFFNDNTDTMNKFGKLISAKNYKFGSDSKISIRHSGDANVGYLVNLVGHDFATHYCNVMVHSRKGKKIANVGLTTENIPYQKNAIAAVKLLAAHQGLAGWNTGQNHLTNTFVVNDKSTGKIKVYSIKELLETISNLEPNKIDSIVSGTPKTLTMQWYGSGRGGVDYKQNQYKMLRSGSVWHKLNSQKLSIGINIKRLIN